MTVRSTANMRIKYRLSDTEVVSLLRPNMDGMPTSSPKGLICIPASVRFREGHLFRNAHPE